MPADPSVPSHPQAAAVCRQMQCWECRRRRLVCDGTQPVCTKCRAARIVCPGYADKKPLTWLAPGQVVSRTRKGKPTRKAGGSSQGGHTKGLDEFEGGGQTDLSQADDALHFLRPFDLRTETYDVFEAMIYYNSRIYQDLVDNQLGPSAFIVPLYAVNQIPPPILHTLVSTAISHRIIQMAEDPGRNELVKPIWTRLYRHRDHAIRAINVLVSNEQSRGGMLAILSVYTFLFAMLQQSLEPRWRTHVDGLMSLIELRGSFTKIITLPGMSLGMMALCIVGIFSNTTSPRDNQFQVASTEETIGLIDKFYTETFYPMVSCPGELVKEIILTSALRSQPPSPGTTRSANDILARIEAFSPQEWTAATRESFHEDWLLISGLYHAATALYCILSLQSSGAFPDPQQTSSSAKLELARARHARYLFAQLERAIATPRVRRRMSWALIVAGVEASRASGEVQRYIGEKLADMSRDQGIASPLVAKGVLERYWARGGGRWDECFDDAFAIIM
ncbi:hypothetical protein MFIFM68171_01671 [Madurella fahalii]|uniref:Zn(2)-C6 fungal-type domain-containing protein n=1 Tax=Madurella fahalii TaxID=1157608 RepID=A0ABQ0G114_9PEZI